MKQIFTSEDLLKMASGNSFTEIELEEIPEDEEKENKNEETKTEVSKTE